MRKRIDQIEVITEQKPVSMPYFAKTFATNQCIWCNQGLDNYQIVCNFCHNCQYCGMVAFGFEVCQNCGNQVDDELRMPDVGRETVIFSE
jgi:hypothetical protein